MKTAFECFHHSAKCEDLARHARTDADEKAMTETARQWRTLGEVARAREAREGPYPPKAEDPPALQDLPATAARSKPRGAPKAKPRRGRRILGLL